MCRSSGCVPLSTNTARLIWIALSAPKGYPFDITTIYSHFVFLYNTARRVINLGEGNIVKVAFVLALSIFPSSETARGLTSRIENLN